jgi:hypothetical protein
MRKVFFLTALAVVIIIGLELGNRGKTPEQSPVAASSKTAVQAAVQDLANHTPAWQSVATEIDDPDYYVTVNYRETPSIGVPEEDSELIIRTILRALVNQGREPSQESLHIGATMQQPLRGETGRSLVRVFGQGFYDYNNDQITFTHW